jgi:hypothetical protein
MADLERRLGVQGGAGEDGGPAEVTPRARLLALLAASAFALGPSRRAIDVLSAAS